MTQFIAGWRSFAQAQGGAVAVEYGLIAGGLLLAIYPAFYLITSSLGMKFQSISDAFAFFN